MTQLIIYKVCTTCVHCDKSILAFPCYKCTTNDRYECSCWEPKEGYTPPEDKD